MTSEDIADAMEKSIDIFSDYVIVEELYRNRMRKAELEC